jgi:hypothetical protein
LTDLSCPALAGVALAVTLGYTVFGFGGFGANLVALPLLAHVMTLRFAVPMLLVLDLFSAVLMGFEEPPLIDKGELLRLLPLAAAGHGAGRAGAAAGARSLAAAAAGRFVLSYSLWSLLGNASPAPVSPRWAMPAGLVGGVFSTLFGTGGPIYTLYLARRMADTIAGCARPSAR